MYFKTQSWKKHSAIVAVTAFIHKPDIKKSEIIEVNLFLTFFVNFAYWLKLFLR